MKMKSMNISGMKKKIEAEMKAFGHTATEKAKADLAKIQARVEKALAQHPELDRLQKQLPLEVRRFKKFVKGSRKELDLAIAQLKTAVEKLSSRGSKKRPTTKSRKTTTVRARKAKAPASAANTIDSST